MKPILSLALVLLLSHGIAAQQSPDENKTKVVQRFKHTKYASVVYKKATDHELKCDLYVPKFNSPRPVFLAIHGGAWTTGSKLAMLRHARILANRGYLVMSINYRLAPDHKWPAQIHDCKHAVRWIRENADKYNADPNQVYAFGYSAGAHLSLLLATTDSDDGLEGEVKAPFDKHSSRIDGCIVGGSPCNFSWIDDDSNTLAYWLSGSPSTAPENYKQASPMSWLTPDDPAIVLFHGSSDNLVPVSSPTAFHEKCQEVGLLSDLSITSDGHAKAFTRTTLLLNALTKFKKMLVEQQARRQLKFLGDEYQKFEKDKGAPPHSSNELLAWMKAEKANFPFPQPHPVAGVNVDPRNDRPFEIPWGKEWPKPAQRSHRK